jgi:preprotein translocase subunit SecY
MKKILRKATEILHNKSLMKKLYWTLGILAIYRLLVFVPIPFVDLQTLMSGTLEAGAAGGFGYLIMLMGGALSNFALVAIGVSPYITASIILQLLSSVIPHLEELTEQGEVGQAKINQYTRYLTFPMAFLQGIGMVFIMNSMLGGAAIDTGNLGIVLLTAFLLSVGSMLLMRLGEVITEKGISNGISMLIFASIVSGIVQQAYTSLTTGNNRLAVLVFMLAIVLVLILLSIFILKSTKEIPVIYARSGKVQQSSILPIPLNPVGMVPIIFAMAFVSFPYLISQLITQFQPANEKLMAIANWVQMHLNIYSQNPGRIAIVLYVIFIVAFTFLYTLITFSPDRISDNIQKRGGFIPGIRPGKATAQYINGILMHLCLRGGLGLALVAIYSYLLNWFPFITSIAQTLGGMPVVVAGSGIIIIVGVVQDLINKVDTELVMAKYEKY